MLIPMDVIPANAVCVIPANAGIQKPKSQPTSYWAPAFAGATDSVIPTNATAVIPTNATAVIPANAGIQ